MISNAVIDYSNNTVTFDNVNKSVYETLATIASSSPLPLSDFYRNTTATMVSADEALTNIVKTHEMLSDLSAGSVFEFKNGDVFYGLSGTVPMIREVIFHDNTHTTIRWADGTSTDVSCGEGEQYNEYEGFCAAIVKKLFGGTGAAKRVMREKNLTEQRRIAKEAEAKQRQEEAEALARKKARAKKRYIKKMAKKMLLEEEIRKAAEKMKEGN